MKKAVALILAAAWMLCLAGCADTAPASPAEDAPAPVQAKIPTVEELVDDEGYLDAEGYMDKLEDAALQGLDAFAPLVTGASESLLQGTCTRLAQLADSGCSRLVTNQLQMADAAMVNMCYYKPDSDGRALIQAEVNFPVLFQQDGTLLMNLDEQLWSDAMVLVLENVAELANLPKNFFELPNCTLTQNWIWCTKQVYQGCVDAMVGYAFEDTDGSLEFGVWAGNGTDAPVTLSNLRAEITDPAAGKIMETALPQLVLQPGESRFFAGTVAAADVLVHTQWQQPQCSVSFDAVK